MPDPSRKKHFQPTLLLRNQTPWVCALAPVGIVIQHQTDAKLLNRAIDDAELERIAALDAH